MLATNVDAISQVIGILISDFGAASVITLSRFSRIARAA